MRVPSFLFVLLDVECQGRIVSKRDPLCRSVEWPDRSVEVLPLERNPADRE